jgi:protein tyrosine phosphatase (PTP) superfamily phosphohydrolase (DUF442 family)
MDIESSYNFRKISDQLTTSGIVRSDGLKALAAQGYEVVVNLLPDTSEHAIVGEREMIESQAIEYIHIPVDFKLPTRADFVSVAAVLDRVTDKKLHIHCAANYRVSAFYSLYAVRRGRWSVDQAWEFMSGIWRPADHPGWAEFISDILDGAQHDTAFNRADSSQITR